MSIPIDVMRSNVLAYAPIGTLSNFVDIYPEHMDLLEDRIFTKSGRALDYIVAVQNADTERFRLLLDRDLGLAPNIIKNLQYFVNILVNNGSYEILKVMLDSELISDEIKKEIVKLILGTRFVDLIFLLNHDNEMMNLARDYLPDDILITAREKLPVSSVKRLQQRLDMV